MARRGLAFDQRDASSRSGERDGSGTACHSTTEDENFILQGIAPDSPDVPSMCSWIPYFYRWWIVGQLGGYGPVVSSDLEGASFGRWTMRYRQTAARCEFVPVEPEVDQNDGGQSEGDDANPRQYVAKMAPVGGHKVEYAGGDKGKRDRIGAGHPLAVHGDLSVTRGDHGSRCADDPCSALRGGPRQPGTSGGKGDPGKGADEDADEVHAAYEAMELQVTLPKARRELQRAGQQSEGSEERVRDEESAVGYDLQAVSMVHGVIGEEKDL